MIRKSSMLLLLLLVFVVAMIQFAYPIQVILNNPTVFTNKISNSEIVQLASHLTGGDRSSKSWSSSATMIV